ncbi:hypothetical protein GCM10027159_08010 [Lysobacter terrae]
MFDARGGDVEGDAVGVAVALIASVKIAASREAVQLRIFLLFTNAPEMCGGRRCWWACVTVSGMDAADQAAPREKRLRLRRTRRGACLR